MQTRKVRWAAAALTVTAITSSVTATTPGEAVAATKTVVTPATNVTTAAAAPCGLSYRGPVFGQYRYTIRNCHGYPVKRKLDLRKLIIGYPDGPCHRIRAHSSVSAWISIPDSVYIAGMKRC